MSTSLRLAVLSATLLTAFAGPALADKIANKVAVFSGLDKITGRIISFDVYIDETVQFGALRVTPKVCYTRSATEAADTDGFVQVDEITLDKQVKRIFDGWMFASSPGLNAVEHPVYDVWLTDCRMDSDVPPPSASAQQTPRIATAEQPAGGATVGAAAGGEVNLTLVGGIPVPPVKPAVPAMIDSTDPNAPSEETGAPDAGGDPGADPATAGQILD